MVLTTASFHGIVNCTGDEEKSMTCSRSRVDRRFLLKEHIEQY